MTVTAIEIPTALVVQQARDALRPLAELVHAKRFDDVRLRAECDGDTVDVTVPRAAYQLLLEGLAQLSNGNAVTVVPVHAELTTQQAAALLNVSRPHLVHLLEDGALPFRKVGTHRRVLAEDVIAYRLRGDEQRRQAADGLPKPGHLLESHPVE